MLVRGNRIAGVYPSAGVPAVDARVIDGRNRYLAPGFIDMHCHGGGGHDFMDATPEAFIGAAETHARYGTATLLPTTLAGDDEDLKKTFEAFRQVKKIRHRGANMPGMHLEGPYFRRNTRGRRMRSICGTRSPQTTGGSPHGQTEPYCAGVRRLSCRVQVDLAPFCGRRGSFPRSRIPPPPMMMCWRLTKTAII